MHHQRKFRERNPLRAIFRSHLDHAKERRIPVLWTFEEFVRFCHRTNYPEKLKDGYTIDRKDAALGYSTENCQVLTRSENGYKGMMYDWRTRKFIKPPVQENPF